METKTTAELIESARKDADRTITWTAEKSGISLSTFKRKINGGTDFTVSETRRVAKALGCKPWELLPEDFMPHFEGVAA